MVKNLNKNIDDLILEYIFYLLPVFVILGNLSINLSLSIVFLIFIYKQIFRNKWKFIKSKYFKIFIIFYLYLLLNSFFSLEISISLQRSIFYLRFFIFVLVYKEFIESEKIDLNKVAKFWSLVILVLSFDIFFQAFKGHDIFGYISGDPHRNSGFFFDELVAGNFLLSFTFIVIILLDKKLENIYLFLFLGLVLFTSLLTGERANFIKFLLLFSIVIFMIKPLNIKYLIIFSIIFSIIISALYSFKGSDIKERYFHQYTADSNLNYYDKYLTSHYGAHTINSYLVTKNNLLFGVGNKNFRIACVKYEKEAAKIQGDIYVKNNLPISKYYGGCLTHPHQIYNELLSEHGIVGTLIIFILFSFLAFNRISNKKITKLNIISGIYILCFFIPVIPTGSMFTTLTSMLFWMNFLFFLIQTKEKNV